MKRFTKRHSPAYSKLDHGGYKRIREWNEVNKDENKILHFSYNLMLTEAEEDRGHRLIDEEDYAALPRHHPASQFPRSILQFCKLDTGKEFRENKKTQNDNDNSWPEDSKTMPEVANIPFIFYNGGMQGIVQDGPTERPKLSSVSAEQPNRTICSNGRKCGLGETSNVSLMCHKLRKKAVCDFTDNSHYQRQFLRIMNKRF